MGYNCIQRVVVGYSIYKGAHMRVQGLKVEYTPIVDMIADSLIKVLPRAKHTIFVR